MATSLAISPLTDKSSPPPKPQSGGKRVTPGGVYDKLVESLTDDCSWRAPRRRCADPGIPGVICVFDPSGHLPPEATTPDTGDTDI
jgi:hypothetical protein